MLAFVCCDCAHKIRLFFFHLGSSWIRQCDSGELIHQCVVSLFLFSNPYFCVVKILYVKLLAVKCSSFVCSYVCVYQNLISSLLYYVMCYILCVFHSPIVMFFPGHDSSLLLDFAIMWLSSWVAIIRNFVRLQEQGGDLHLVDTWERNQYVYVM